MNETRPVVADMGKRREQYDVFAEHVRAQYPGFGFPFLAIPGNRTEVHCFNSGLQGGTTKDTIDAEGRIKGVPIDDWIYQLTLPRPVKGVYTRADSTMVGVNLTALVECAETEMFPEAMQRLEDHFKITRILL
ncbi:hypothetical protein HN419_06370 [Candidatus Woesearchaeota archaeon]|jgi:hypothetical protein|nr:hypothetical protein [Candidatus Woesearchaeota archaeon]MBT3538119.1 hypothetical protein [Candidatus Woesearchaeota archaeon]MBT4697522.1 hypothetical protein [Candidatus Woesearchaeota archaeon]MBT4717369.1 hypothetical protein [Candidatus Woesearchaeota archaeon]MBT7105788.1 hypothetical protein [Candidatus Woesearchaeota archaeon]